MKLKTRGPFFTYLFVVAGLLSQEAAEAKPVRDSFLDVCIKEMTAYLKVNNPSFLISEVESGALDQNGDAVEGSFVSLRAENFNEVEENRFFGEVVTLNCDENAKLTQKAETEYRSHWYKGMKLDLEQITHYKFTRILDHIKKYKRGRRALKTVEYVSYGKPDNVSRHADWFIRYKRENLFNNGTTCERVSIEDGWCGRPNIDCLEATVGRPTVWKC